jgi:hypothetical protein
VRSLRREIPTSHRIDKARHALGRIRYILLLARAGERIRRYRHPLVWPWNDTHGDQVFEAVVTDTNDLVGLGLHPLEFGMVYVGRLALAVACAESRLQCGV